jgi:PAS domain S-box-containing protein
MSDGAPRPAQNGAVGVEERYRAMFQNTRDAIFVLDDSRCLECNPFSLEMFGVAPEEIIGRAPMEFSPELQPDGRPSAIVARDRVDAALAGQPQFFEWRCLRKDGTAFDAEVSMSRFASGGGYFLLAVVRDVTDRKRAEAALQAEKDLCQRLVQLSPTFIVAIGPDFKTVLVNDTMLSALGYREEEVVGRDYMQTFVPELERPALVDLFAYIVARHRVPMFENHVLTKAGRQVLCQWHTIPVFSGDHYDFFIGVGIDITEARRAAHENEKLRAQLVKATQAISSERVLENLVETLVHLVLESAGAERGALLLEEGGVLAMVARASTREGVSLERAPLGTDWPEAVIHHVWRSGDPLILADAKIEGAFVDDACVRGRGLRSVLCVPVRCHGRSVGVVYLENNVTPRAFTNETLEIVRHLAAQLALSIENAQLLRTMQGAERARDDFLKIAAHELRTPLTPLFLQISAATSAMRTVSPDMAKRATELLESAKRQLDRLGELVEHLLDISQVTSSPLTLRREPTDLVVVVREVVARLEANLCRAQSTVRVEAPRPVLGAWDRQRLEQVVTQLLSNAAKFGAGAPIDVRVDSINGVARLSVQDHGIGLALQDQKRIFRPFERAVSARHYGGFGIGLWLTQQIIEAHGGAIRVESQPAAGARFIVELPQCTSVGSVTESDAWGARSR